MSHPLLQPKPIKSITAEMEADSSVASSAAEILKAHPNILNSAPEYGSIEWAMKVRVMASRHGNTPAEETRYAEEFWDVMWNL